MTYVLIHEIHCYICYGFVNVLEKETGNPLLLTWHEIVL